MIFKENFNKVYADISRPPPFLLVTCWLSSGKEAQILLQLIVIIVIRVFSISSFEKEESLYSGSRVSCD